MILGLGDRFRTMVHMWLFPPEDYPENPGPMPRRVVSLVLPVRCRAEDCHAMRKVRLLVGVDADLRVVVFSHPTDAQAWEHGMDVAQIDERCVIQEIEPSEDDDNDTGW